MFGLTMLAGGWQTGAWWRKHDVDSGAETLFVLAGQFYPCRHIAGIDFGRSRAEGFMWARGEAHRDMERYRDVSGLPDSIFRTFIRS